MSAERWFGKKTLPLVTVSPVIADWRNDGIVQRSPFEDADIGEPMHAEAVTSTPLVTPESAPERHELVMFPAVYEAVSRRASECPSCVFVTADGRPFSRSYGHLQGADWLHEKKEGFALFYGGTTVEVRGRGLWPVFLALGEHRASIVRQFDPDRWELPTSGPVITHIAAKVTD